MRSPPRPTTRCGPELHSSGLKQFSEVTSECPAQIVHHPEGKVLVALLGPRDGRLAEAEALRHLDLRYAGLFSHT